jgi:hypothetical protein
MAASCSDISMVCAGVVSIRIFDRNDPPAPYVSVCEDLNGKQDLCSIAGVSLPPPAHPIQAQKLEVQMVIDPSSALTRDPFTHKPQCPTDVRFTDTGFPQPVDACTDPELRCPIVPAVGGRAFYTPGDTETVVDLGCSDIHQLTDPATCGGQNRHEIKASVDDYDTEVPVSPSLADLLAVSVGEPIAVGPGYVLNGARPLDRTVVQPIPAWGANVDLKLVDMACLEVHEEVAQSTTSLRCKPFVPGQTPIDITGIRLARSTLADILVAIGQPQFPDKGLVVGIVLDYLGNPAPNFIVTASDPSAHIDYLSANRRNLILGGTSTSGAWVSVDAPFKTRFSTQSGTPPQIATGFGGLVANKVTIVVLQLDQKVIGM